LSGVSNDLRKVITAMDDEGNERAQLAYDVYIHTVSAAASVK
jgi:acetate kinase